MNYADYSNPKWVELRDAFVDMINGLGWMDSTGKNAALRLLHAYDVKRLSDLPPEQWPAMLDDCNTIRSYS